MPIQRFLRQIRDFFLNLCVQTTELIEKLVKKQFHIYLFEGCSQAVHPNDFSDRFRDAIQQKDLFPGGLAQEGDRRA
jgi:hypothetical protein